jgi:hypothetical protein
MRNVLNESCKENQNTHFVFSNFFPPENRAVNEIMSKYMVETSRPQMTICRRIACWISKATRAKAYENVLHPQPHPHPPRTHARTQTHTHRTCNTYCFSTARVVS